MRDSIQKDSACAPDSALNLHRYIQAARYNPVILSHYIRSRGTRGIVSSVTRRTMTSTAPPLFRKQPLSIACLQYDPKVRVIV